ncbi:MAG: MATE family efflux transporter, partial [Alphaproteobacteria bacterium]|nr:MATE family efflux transporter [Alphaproteobacteria bacterium]
LIFMISVGIATATGVRVGNAHGRKDLSDKSLAGWTGLGVLMIVLIPVALLIYLAPSFTLSLYLDDPVLVLQGSAILAIIAIISFGDGGQVVLQSCLRGTGDKWAPTLISFFCYFVVMVPSGYILTQIYDLGLAGLFYAILIGSVLSISLLFIRWARSISNA